MLGVRKPSLPPASLSLVCWLRVAAHLPAAPFDGAAAGDGVGEEAEGVAYQTRRTALKALPQACSAEIDAGNPSGYHLGTLH